MKLLTHILPVLLAVTLTAACEKVGKNEWSEIDYSKVARENYQRQNDTAYVPPPSVLGCVDDDLMNCNRRRAY